MISQKFFRCLLFIFLSFLITSISTGSEAPGNYVSHHPEQTGITFAGEQAALSLHWYKPEVIRVDYLDHPDALPDSSYAVIQKPDAKLEWGVEEAEDHFFIKGKKVNIRVEKYPLRVLFLDKENHLLIEEALPVEDTGNEEGPRKAEFELPEDLNFYGTGMRGVGFNLRGLELEVYNRQNYGYHDALETMNVNIPMTVTNGSFALFFDNRWRSWFDLGKEAQDRFSFRSKGGGMTYYFIYGEDVPEQLKHYTWLTGRQPLPPKWSLGFIQSKFGYSNETEARGVADTLRAMDIPADVIILDLEWMEHMGDMQWDRNAFPDPYTMVNDFKEMGLQTVLISQPYMVEWSKNFPEADIFSYLVMDEQGDTYLMEHWWSCDGECAGVLIDFTNPQARKWWWSKHPPVMQNDTANIAGYWTDLGEPERHHEDMVHHRGEVEEVNNTYNLKWAQILFNGHAEMRPEERIFNLSRSGSAGIQRYATIPWSGDVGRSFSALSVQPHMVLNQGLSGMVWHHSDLGGFTGDDCIPELYVRWIQHGIFSPIARAHGNEQCPTEPWGYGPEALDASLKFIHLRYELMPYLYSMAWKTWTHGMPVSRPLFFEDPEDEKLYEEGETHLWGSDFLVSPVVEEGQTSKEVYLPKGRWVDFWDNTTHGGRQTVTVDTPLDRIPVFVKAGAIIPTQTRQLYTSQHPFDTLILDLYPDEVQNGHFVMYEDDGLTLDYQEGRYSTTAFSLDQATGSSLKTTLKIESRKGEYSAETTERVYRARFRNTETPSEVTLNGRRLNRADSMQQLRHTEAAFYTDAANRKVYVQIAGSTVEEYEIVVTVE